jgi:hypothetical protein
MERKNEKRKIYIYTPLVDTAHIYIYTGIQREMVFLSKGNGSTRRNGKKK